MSLGEGTVRAAEFATGAHWYRILLQVQKNLPAQQLVCMMGVTTGPLNDAKCLIDDPLLHTEWVVVEGERTVAKGSGPDRGASGFAKDYMIKF